MVKFAANLFERVFSLSLAFIFLQIPEFIFQYVLRLSGHIQELQLHIASLTTIANSQQKSLQEYIAKFLKSSDTDFSSQGAFMNDLLKRFDYLKLSLEKIENASPFLKPFVFIKNMDLSIVNSTFGSFTVGLKFTIESLIYLLAGLFVGYSCFIMIKKIFKKREAVNVKRIS
jgi:hypothetical protein